MFLNRTLIPYFMEFLDIRELIYFSSINNEYLFYLKTFIEIENNNESFKYSCLVGNKKLVYLFSDRNNWNWGMAYSAEGGHKELVDIFVSKCHNSMNDLESNCIELVNFCIEREIKFWNFGMIYAARGGHEELVDFFISKGANDWNFGMYYAAEGGHKELVEFFISKGADDWNWGIYYASLGGHKELIEFFELKLNNS